MSESTLSSTRNYSRSRRSIISSSSDIKFTRKKLTSQYKCGCFIIASFLVLLLIAAAALYIGYNFFGPEFQEPLTFRGTFKIISGDYYTSDLADSTSKQFQIRSRDYRERLNLLFRRSLVRYGFIGTDILALDGTENKDLVVHFTLNVNPKYTKVSAKDLEDIIIEDLKVENSILFKNITIEQESLTVIPNNLIPESTTIHSTLPYEIETTPVAPKQCVPAELAYCSKATYKITSYPNIFDHKSVKDVENNIIPFRELVDAECYNHTYQFVCNLLEPYCVKEDVNILPCKSFCKHFMKGCGSRLPENLKEAINCDRFAENNGVEDCFIEPDCGIQKKRNTPEFTKTAKPGDWPWHTVLLKENVHICDGTLVSPIWVATTASCFQGQPKAEWIARFGSYRLSGTPNSLLPQEQTRRIVGMVKSPVEGSTIALIKLESPVFLSDLIRPICLPQRRSEMATPSNDCNTLGWSRDGPEQLKRIQVTATAMEKCENISISTLNSVCAEIAFGHENCQEEEYAGNVHRSGNVHLVYSRNK